MLFYYTIEFHKTTALITKSEKRFKSLQGICPFNDGNLANGAIYLLEPECLQWLNLHPDKKDFSTEVLPHFIGRIATWENNEIHRDIGSINALRRAQSDPLPEPCWPEIDEWQEEFERSSIFSNLYEALHIVR